MESLQESVYLRLDGSRHPQLRHQLDILCLREDTHTHTDQSPPEILMDKRKRQSSYIVSLYAPVGLLSAL